MLNYDAIPMPPQKYAVWRDIAAIAFGGRCIVRK
jgi:hypothetical protein